MAEMDDKLKEYARLRAQRFKVGVYAIGIGFLCNIGSGMLFGKPTPMQPVVQQIEEYQRTVSQTKSNDAYGATQYGKLYGSELETRIKSITTTQEYTIARAAYDNAEQSRQTKLGYTGTLSLALLLSGFVTMNWRTKRERELNNELVEYYKNRAE